MSSLSTLLRAFFRVAAEGVFTSSINSKSFSVNLFPSVMMTARFTRFWSSRKRPAKHGLGTSKPNPDACMEAADKAPRERVKSACNVAHRFGRGITSWIKRRHVTCYRFQNKLDFPYINILESSGSRWSLIGWCSLACIRSC